MTDQQALQEFTTNLLSDLSSQSLTVYEALSACSQYAFLRSVLDEHKDELAAAELSGETVLFETLVRILSGTNDNLSNLPNFNNVPPDAPKDEERVRDDALLRAHASERVRAYEKTDKELYKEKQRAFIHELVQNYSTTKRPNEDRVARYIEESIARAAKKSSDAPPGVSDVQASLVQHIDELDSTMTGEDKRAFARAVEQTITDHAAYVTHAAMVEHKEQFVINSLYEASPERPDVFVDIMLHAPKDEPLSLARVRGERLARAAHSLEAHPKQKRGNEAFFTTEKAKGAAAALQKGADGILSIASEPVREMILKEKIEGSLRNIITGSQKAVDRLGETFVRSAQFTHIAQALQKQTIGNRGASGVGGAVSDVVGSVFRGPLAAPDRLATTTLRGPLFGRGFGKSALGAAADERVLDFFELSRANAASPRGKGFLPEGVAPWHVFSGRARAQQRVRGSHSGFFPSIGFGALNGINSLLSGAFTTAVDGATSFLFTNPILGRQMAGSRRAARIPTPIADDLPLLLSLFVIGVIILLFILPSPFNIPQTMRSAKVSALISALSQKDASITHEVICEDCKWPTNGCISQGPNTPYDSHSAGSDSNAVDIAASLGEPVISITDGTVVSSQDGCANLVSPTCNSGYGNNVVIRSSEGKTYRYAHLLKGSVIDNGATVSKGTKIGLVDSSGASTGSHLHFELVAGNSGSVNDILPITVPECVGQYDILINPVNCPKLMGGREKSCVTIN